MFAIACSPAGAPASKAAPVAFQTLQSMNQSAAKAHAEVASSTAPKCESRGRAADESAVRSGASYNDNVDTAHARLGNSSTPKELIFLMAAAAIASSRGPSSHPSRAAAQGMFASHKSAF